MPSFDWRRIVGLGGPGNYPNSTGLGPDFPESAGDRERSKFRPSQYPRLTKVAVGTDNGDEIGTGSEGLLTRLDRRLSAIEQQLLLAKYTPQKTQEIEKSGGGIWQIRTLEVEIAGITTQTTAYATVDAVGTGQSINFGANPNNFVLLQQMIVSYDLAPTTTQVALLPAFFSAQVTAQTDNGKIDLTPAELRSVVLAYTGNVGQLFGGIQNDTGGAIYPNVTLAKSEMPLMTAADGSVWLQCSAASAFTIASAGRVWLKFIYRYGNFAGFA